MNLQFLKALGVLFLLLSGNPAVAHSFTHNPEDVEKEEISYEISEDSPELSQSTLAGPQFTQSPSFFSGEGDNFYFRSTYVTREASLYITFSRSIDPNLDIAVIIFPFHFFL